MNTAARGWLSTGTAAYYRIAIWEGNLHQRSGKLRKDMKRMGTPEDSALFLYVESNDVS